MGNFPLWMYRHYALPAPLSYPHWLINNSIFLLVLVSGLTIYLSNYLNHLVFGAGIALWAVLNSFEHIFFSIKDGQLSTGIFSGIGFFILGILVMLKLKIDGKLTIRLLLNSILVAIGYWLTAIMVILFLGNFLAQKLPPS